MSTRNKEHLSLKSSMVVGHLPVGYMTSKFLFRMFEARQVSYRWFMFWGLFGSIAPDADMSYHYLFDYEKTHHHLYFTHFLLFWLLLLLLSIALLLLDKKRHRYPVFPFIFTLGGFFHLVLDTLAGGMTLWKAPFSRDQFFLKFIVPWGETNHVLLSYGLEAIVIVLAVLVWYRGRKKDKAPVKPDPV